MPKPPPSQPPPLSPAISLPPSRPPPDRPASPAGVAGTRAAPPSLFFMGVEPGPTTVIATGDTGEAIVQYDVTVTPGGKAAAGAAAAAPAAGISPETAAAIQAAIT